MQHPLALLLTIATLLSPHGALAGYQNHDQGHGVVVTEIGTTAVEGELDFAAIRAFLHEMERMTEVEITFDANADLPAIGSLLGTEVGPHDQYLDIAWQFNRVGLPSCRFRFFPDPTAADELVDIVRITNALERLRGPIISELGAHSMEITFADLHPSMDSNVRHVWIEVPLTEGLNVVDAQKALANLFYRDVVHAYTVTNVGTGAQHIQFMLYSKVVNDGDGMGALWIRDKAHHYLELLTMSYGATEAAVGIRYVRPDLVARK